MTTWICTYTTLVFIISSSHAQGCNFGGSGCLFACHCRQDGPCDQLTGLCINSTSCGAQTIGLGKFWSGPGCLTGDISGEKNADQSDGAVTAKEAVDAVRRLCTQVHSRDTHAWWTVDLGELYFIHNVTIYTREPTSIYHVVIRVSNVTTSTGGGDYVVCGSTTGVQQASITNTNNTTIHCTDTAIGSYVTLYKSSSSFTVCEVVVTGHRYADCSGCTGHCNREYGCVDVCPVGRNQSTLCTTDCTANTECPGSCAHCKDGTSCNSTTGTCPNGCQPWWTTDYCNRYIDKVNFYSTSGVIVHQVTTMSFNMSWTPIYQDMDALILNHYGYEIQQYSNTWTINRKIAANITSAIVQGLEHNTNYTYRVRSYRTADTIQYGVKTIAVNVKTTCIEPGPPDDININVTDPEGATEQWIVNITWQLPAETGCDRITHTGISWNVSGQHREVNKTTNDTYLIIYMDSPGNYMVRTRVYNNEDVPSRIIENNLTIVANNGDYTESADDDRSAVHTLLVIIVTSGVGVGVFFIIIITACTLLCKTKKKQHITVSSDNNNVTSSTMVGDVSEQGQPGNGSIVMPSPGTEPVIPEEEVTLIPAEQFETYFHEHMKQEHTMKDKFHKIPKDGLGSSDVAELKCNIFKNRYKNIIPYDHNRVPLTDTNGQHNDYINASFITGYPAERCRYVAAQGPKLETIEDFWRMVAMYNITCIVMLTSCAEDSKKLCDIYWPKKVGEIEVYGSAVVQLDAEVVMAHYTVRNLNVQCQDRLLDLRHYQMTSWRDKTKPDSPLPMMKLVNIVRRTHSNDQGPALIHCSAGAGRTGTYIAIDCLLDQAGAEACVDVDGLLYRMRTERPWMVQTLNQYIFIHEVLICYFKLGQTLTPASQLASSSQYDAARLVEMFQDLASLKLPDSPSKAGMLAENVKKNRLSTVIPDDKFRPFLCQPYDQGTDYINAVFCDSFWRHDNVILSQLPLNDTIVDFWRMVFDHDVGTILLLDNLTLLDGESMEQFWPDECKQVYGPLVVEGLHKMADPSNDSVVVWDLTVALHRKPQESISVTLYQYMSWASCETVPPKLTQLLRLVNMMEQPLMSSRRTIIQCLDGVNHCSLFLAACHVITQAVVWEQVDIPLTTLGLRERRPTSISQMEQFQFLNDLVQVHMSRDKRMSVNSMSMLSTPIPTLPRTKPLNWNVTRSTNDISEPTYGNTITSPPANEKSEYMSMIASQNRLHLNAPVDMSGHFFQPEPLYVNTISESKC